jgi:DNA-directed RNA polymerase subunit RPC12/RpoP
LPKYLTEPQKPLKVKEPMLFKVQKTRRNKKTMSDKNQSESGLAYECVKCGARVALDELELRGGGVKCTYCGYRVLKKMRPPVVKRVKTG